MKRACYPGSFDPPTYGHLDIITRASSVFDELIIAIMKNPNKRNAFTEEERVRMLQEITRDLPNVKVVVGLQQATANMFLDETIETVFFVARPRYSFLSSSVSKEIALNNGDLTKFIPEAIINEVEEELNPQKKDRQRIPVGNKPTEKG